MSICDLTIATGGPAMVKAAYSSGKPAYGVGPGNATMVIDETADIEEAARSTRISKTNDNGSGCSADGNLIIDASIYAALLSRLQQEGGYLVNDDEKAKLEKAYWDADGHRTPQTIARPAARVAQLAGFTIPADKTFLIVPEDKIGKEYRFSGEKLGTVLAVFKYEGWEMALRMVQNIYEVGGRGSISTFDYSTAIYAERSTHVILRDANGFNVSNGKLESAGIEWDLGWTPFTGNRLSVIGTYARHTYAFDRQVTGGETIKDGHDVDTAPRWLGSAHWRYTPTPNIVSEVEMVYQGRYYLDAASTANYDGFTMWNWRGEWQANPHWRVFMRVMNIGDIRYADRADIAFGSYRYFPGTPRQMFAGVEFSLGDMR
jgi:hypothetical protein